MKEEIRCPSCDCAKIKLDREAAFGAIYICLECFNTFIVMRSDSEPEK